MPTLHVKSTPVSFTEAGRGEPVILLHSSGCSSSQWCSLREHLKNRFQVLAPDLHGYGWTGDWSDARPPRLADEAELVLALMARRAEPVHLVGHSYGGAVALRLALEHGARLRSLTLIEPVAFHLLTDAPQADAKALAEILDLAGCVAKMVAERDLDSAMRVFVDYWNGAGAWSALPEDKRQALISVAPKVASDFHAITTEQPRPDEYRVIDTPTLLLHGGRSPAPALRVTDLLSRILPDNRLQEVPGAGHMLPLTHRDAVNAAIAYHLRAHAVQTPWAA